MTALRPNLAHTVIRYLIRGTGTVMALGGAAGAVTSLIAIVNALLILNAHAWMSFVLLFPAVVSVVFLVIGYQMWRSVNATAVKNFAFIISYLTAVNLYFVLPLHLPPAMVEWMGNNSLASQSSPAGPSYRYALGLLAFFVFYWAIDKYLLQLLGLSQAPLAINPTDMDPMDPSIPDFPGKSPLVELS